MEAFKRLRAGAMPLAPVNVDTDQMIPARFLKRPRSDGYGNFLFHDMRFDAEGRARPEFALNTPPYDAAKILVANANFGSGSSREGAVYALHDYGFRCVIAPSFGDIFYINALNNGVLPIRLPAADVAELRRLASERPDAEFDIDLEEQTVTAGNLRFHFDIDAKQKRNLAKGQDVIDATQEHADATRRFIEDYGVERPWMMFDR